MPPTLTPDNQQAPPPTAPAPSSDPAEQILRSAQGVDTNAQADAWDAFHQSKNEDELSQRLQNMNIPQDVKANLWDAKHSLTSTQGRPSAAGVPQLDVSKSPDPLAGRYQAYSELGRGAIKGAKETARTVGGWLGEAFGSPNVKPEDQPLASFKNQDLESKTPTESLGKGMESVAEFVLGDEALKGLSLLEKAKHLGDVGKIIEKSPKIAKALDIGANALRQGAVGAGQTLAHGGTPGEALTSGALVGGTGLVLEGAGQSIKAIKNFVTRGPQVEEVGRALVSGLTEGATPEQVARTVGKNLADTEEKMYSTYDAGMKTISAQGKSVPVPIGGSPLKQTAKELLSDTNVPESVAENLKGVVPDTEKIKPLLTQFSNSKEVFSWDQMEATRQKIGQAFRDVPYDSPLRRPLNTLRSAIDDTLEQSAEKAGNSDLSDQIKTLRSGYAQTHGALEERAITALREKNPNAIADILLGKQSVHDVNTLRRLIGPENMKVVEGSILDKMIQNASKNGELQGRQLFRRFNDLGPDAKQAIWGDRLPQVREFMQQAGKLPNVVLNKILSYYAPYALGTAAAGFLGHGDVKTAAYITGGAGLSALLRNPIVLEAALKGIQGLQKVAPAAAAVGTQAVEKDEDEGTNNDTGAGGQAVKSAGQDTSGWRHIQSSGKHYLIHPEDLDEAQRRDANLIVHDQP